MKDMTKTKKQLIEELDLLRARISKHINAEETIASREEELSAVYENAPLIMLLVDKEWRIKKTNAFTAQLTGKSIGDMIDLRCGEALRCIHASDHPEGCGFGPACRDCVLRLTAMDTIETGQSHDGLEISMHLSNGDDEPKATFVISTKKLAIKGQPLALVSLQDITERIMAEQSLTFMIDILTCLNSTTSWYDTINDLLRMIRKHTGCEAAALRLRDGEDFPYFVSNGFPEQFIEVERSLCTRDQQGELMRDTAGNPYLECMCGNVICGRTDPALPFFTQGGSFWTNSTTELLAGTSEEDRQARTRDRCHGEGYESVALIPLHANSETIGLLQINDSRIGRFTLEMIRFLESIGNSIGIAFKRMLSEQALRDSEKRYRLLIENANEAIIAVQDSLITYVNPKTERMMGYSHEELINKPFVHHVHPDDRERVVHNYLRRMEGEPLPSIYTFKVLDRDGLLKHVEINSVKVMWENRPVILAFLTDVTDRTIAEDKLRMSQEQLRALAGRLQIVREDLRKKISREIHDELGQALTGLKIDLSLLEGRLRKTRDKQKRSDLLARTGGMIELIEATVQSVRRIATELRPGILDDLGLVAALEWQIQEFQNRMGITFEFSAYQDQIELNEEISTNVFRIFQESLTNVARHAGATQVAVTVNGEEGWFVLVIKDNGRGISDHEIFDTQSLGILGMRERALQCGGKIDIRGLAGQGTEVTLKVPLRSDAR
jgi:PAS domain S-box-containing protein